MLVVSSLLFFSMRCYFRCLCICLRSNQSMTDCTHSIQPFVRNKSHRVSDTDWFVFIFVCGDDMPVVCVRCRGIICDRKSTEIYEQRATKFFSALKNVSPSTSISIFDFRFISIFIVFILFFGATCVLLETDSNSECNMYKNKQTIRIGEFVM